MKRFLIISMLIAGVFRCLGQINEPPGVLPGPGPSPAPNFTASLDGTHAIPMNNSLFKATAAVYGPFPFFIPPFTNGIFIRVVIPAALLTNNPDIIPAVVGIQHGDGTYVTYPGCPPPDDCGFVLIPPLPPLAPCVNTTNGWVCPPLPIGIFEGRFALTSPEFMELATGQWYASVTFQTSDGMPLPNYAIRGAIFASDTDGDGIPEYLDQCPNTLSGAAVNSNGCSIDQLCPCDGPWRNHGDYINCVTETAAQFQRDGFISEKERRIFLSAAIRSGCGKQ